MLRESLSARKNISVPLLSSCDTSARARSPRHHLLLITAAQDKKGTRIFKFGGKKDSSEATDASVSGTRKFKFGIGKQSVVEEGEEEPNFGTKFFSFGSKKVEEEEGEEEELKFGTKLFSFGPRKKAGTVKGGSIVPKKESTALLFTRPRRQEPNAVFVAGATGQTGARIAQKLLREGFSIRGGVRDLYVAQQLAEFATQYGIISRDEAKRLNAVEFDFKDVESIAKAIGSAAKVVVTIGPTENGPKSKVSFEDASNVVEAAKLANVSNLVVVYEPGTVLSGEGPLAGLTSFFSELFSKPDALAFSELISQIVDSALSYTLLKTSPTEGVDDFPPQTGNIVMFKEGTPIEGAKIAKSQVALVVAEVLSNTGVAENKVIEVSTSLSAAASSIESLLSTIPTDGRRAALIAARSKADEEERERKAREQLEAESRAAVEESRRAALLATQLETEAKQLEAQEVRAATLAEKAQAQAAAAAASVDDLTSKAKELGTDFLNISKSVPSLGFSLPAFSPSSAKGTPKPKPAPSPPKKQQLEPALPSPVVSVPAPKPQVNTIFGGLFSQETVYVDDT